MHPTSSVPIDSGSPAPSTWYADEDSDSFGSEEVRVESTGAPAGYVERAGDCDDQDPSVYPGAIETCDGRDEDCDGDVDEGFPIFEMYEDNDGDGWGAGESVGEGCELLGGTSAESGDCDDDDATTWPGAVEICDDGVRNDCTEGEEPGCRWSGELTLDSYRAWYCTSEGENCGDGPIVGGGDTNGDGIPEVMIGASESSSPGSADNGGGAWWLPGWTEEGGEVTDVGYRIWSPDHQHAMGNGIVFLPDVNADGFDDILTGSPSEGAEEVYLFFGPITSDIVWGDDDVLIDESEAGDFGRDIAISADGSLLAVGANSNVKTDIGWSEDLGRVYVFNALADGRRTADDDAIGTLTASPYRQWLYLGYSVCISDLNGDGIYDVIAGGPTTYADGWILPEVAGGAVYVTQGPISGDLVLDDEEGALIDATARVGFTGNMAGAGWDLSCKGDVDGDGLSDLFIGAPWGWDADGALPGTAALFTGPVTGTPDLSEGAFVTYGAISYGRVGLSVTADSDLDADGFADLAVTGAHETDQRRLSVFYGPVSGSEPVSSSDAWLDESIGYYVEGGFDLDLDGFDDLIMATPYNDEFEKNAGAAWLLPGSGP